MRSGLLLATSGYPGYDEDFDTTGCPYGDPNEPPDIAKAQGLVKQAGAEGAEVTVWGNNGSPRTRHCRIHRHAQ